MQYAYYPGCSLTTTAKEYDYSWRAVCKKLGIGLMSIPDWNCCGASPASVEDPSLAVMLPARSLIYAEEQNLDVIAPCAGCYKNLRKAAKLIHHDANIRQQAVQILGRQLDGHIRVKHPMEVLLLDIGLEALAEKVTRPLSGLKVACYYGCYLTRPDSPFDTVENPQSLDKLMKIIGAEPVPYPFKTRCCGGGIFLTREDLALEMSHRLLTQARRSGADCMVVACPLCDMLLEAYQIKIVVRFGVKHDMPVFFFSQLLGLALGAAKEELGFELRSVSPKRVLARLEASPDNNV